MAGVLVQHLSKRFQLPNGQEKLVLQDVSLEIKGGEFVCLLGPSGCGKTTLLNVLSGLDQNYQGTIHVTRVERGAVSTRANDQPVMSYMFQEPRLLPWLTVRENIRFVLGGRRSEDAERIEQWLIRVGLAGYGNYYPMQLSTGMQQRVSVARALIRNPELLLMDEPFSSLDELTAIRMREELLELWMDQGCTVVFVTHNPLEAVFLADRLVIMSPRPGRITAEIHVQDLLPRPRDADDRGVWELSRQAVRQLRGATHDTVDSKHIRT